MVAKRYIKIFSIAAIVTLLVSSVESAPASKKVSKEPADNNPKDPSGVKCPTPPKEIKSLTDGETKNFIVLVKDEKSRNSHLEMMKTCYESQVQHITDVKNTSEFSKKKMDIREFSVNGTNLLGYSIKTSPEFANVLGKLSTVSLVEEEKEVKIQYALPLNRRAVDNNAPFNLDRIDQAKRPLDGKFNFPDSAGKGVNIFVVDTGILITHSEFGGRAKFGGSFCDGCNEDDENGHGTQVASIAAGKTLGVARKANLIAVRVLDANGSGSNVGVINGLSFVLDQHNKGKNKNSVVNMSLGGTFSAAVNNAVKDLTDAGVHVAAAAGNDGEDACKSSPSSELSAVTVGATEEKDETITDFSNIGKCVDIFAPGRNINGAGIGSDNDQQVFSGTSQATPHVAGTMALLIAKDGNKTPAKLATDLKNLSTKGVVKGIGNTGSPDSFLRTPAP